MLSLKRGPAILGLLLGGVVPSHLAGSDSSRTYNPTSTWMQWLVRMPHDTQCGDSTRDRVVPGLRESPGRVFVWGASFGKIPRQIEALGNRVVQVAASDGIVAGLTDTGLVYGVISRKGVDRIQKLDINAPASSITMRSSANEVVIVDSNGRVHTARLDPEGSFQPAQLLRGALSYSKVDLVRCGSNHCVAITTNGDAVSWGYSNSHGQLGRDDGSERCGPGTELPERVTLPKDVRMQDVACGDRHTIFLDQKGVLYASGDDHWAQLGISAEPWLKSHKKSSSSVRKSELLTGMTGCTVASGGQHSVMVARDGTVFSFGFNQWGQLGHHNYSSLAPPSPIADYTIRAMAVSAGENHTCLVKDTGELLCIGANDHGQLGNGTLQPSMTWKKVRLGKKPIKPSHIHSNGHTCAVVIAEENDSL